MLANSAKFEMSKKILQAHDIVPTECKNRTWWVDWTRKNMPKKYWKRPKTDVWEKQESTNDLAIREEREKNMSQAMLIQMETNLKFDLHNWEHILID